MHYGEFAIVCPHVIYKELLIHSSLILVYIDTKTVPYLSEAQFEHVQFSNKEF
jgi:hypothetical protein